MAVLSRIGLAGILGVGILALGGCATLTSSPTQQLTIIAVDDRQRTVDDLDCTLDNGTGPVKIHLPTREVEVVRSSQDLRIECGSGRRVARATVASHREKLEQALVPLGSVGVLIDHLTGKLYAYPTVLQIHLGEDERLDQGEASRVVASAAVPGAATHLPDPEPVVVASAGTKAEPPAKVARATRAAAAAKAKGPAHPPAKPVRGAVPVAVADKPKAPGAAGAPSAHAVPAVLRGGDTPVQIVHAKAAAPAAAQPAAESKAEVMAKLRAAAKSQNTENGSKPTARVSLATAGSVELP